MLRSSSAAPKVGVALAALVPLGFAFVALRSDGDPPDEAQLTTADATTATTAAAASPTGAPVQQIGLPVADESVAVAPYQAPAATTAAPPSTPAPAPAPPAGAAPGSGHGHGGVGTTSGAPKDAKPVATTAAPVTTAPPAVAATDPGHGGTHTAEGTGNPATGGSGTTTATQPATNPPMGDHDMGAGATGAGAKGDPAGGGAALETHGYSVHEFTGHVIGVLGEQMLAPGQQQYGGYERNGNVITARSPITGVRPVAEQAIAQMKRAHPDLSGVELEKEIAQQLTNLNDWEDLRPKTQEKMMILSGIDIASLDGDVREKAINHLQHSPVPFGAITDVLTPDVVIDLGYTHTLDKKWTIAEDQGGGVFKITLVSNNDNGSHTGHILGSFRVQTPEGTSVRQAKRIGNEMVRNENNNDELLLDDAVKKILYGETPLLDYSQMTPEQKLAAYAGKGLPTM